MFIEALRNRIHRPDGLPPWWRLAALGAAVAAGITLVAVLLSPAQRTPARTTMVTASTPAELDAREAAAGPTGTPLLWRVKGPKATIYLFGSVHILRSNMGWMDPRIYSAFDSAQQVWFEVPDPYAKHHNRLVRQDSFASRPLLLNGLTDQEKGELAQVLRPFDLNPEDIPRLKPEAAAGLALGMANLAMGYEFERGADVSLMHLAQTDKKPVHGFETVDQHVTFINELSPSPHGDGTAALKRALAVYAGQLSPDGSDITSIASCWRYGNEACITRSVLSERQSSPHDYDVLLRRRNANWVPRIEAMVRGTDTIFITVGCAHLVGPDGLVAQLRAAGYDVERVER